MPAYDALVTCFATEDTIRNWIAGAGLRLDRLELDTKQADPGEQRSWIVFCH